MTLLTRLTEAAGPDRELDAEIARTVGHTVRTIERCGEWFADEMLTGSEWIEAPRYTGSVDDALTLVPEGWTASVKALPASSKRLNGARGIAVLWEGAILSETKWMTDEVEAATPALALCIAALRAREVRG